MYDTETFFSPSPRITRYESVLILYKLFSLPSLVLIPLTLPK